MTATLLVLLAACSVPQPLSERALLGSADNNFETRLFALAVEQYREFLDEHPFSPDGERARLRIAHAYYLNRDHEKALVAFNDFERLHPTSRELPFVEYTIGMCHLDRALTAERDPSAVERALRQFERLARRYPRSLYSRLATYRITECNERLARHELRIGEFYLAKGRTEAGHTRLRYIVDKFPGTDTARQAAGLLAAKRD